IGAWRRGTGAERGRGSRAGGTPRLPALAGTAGGTGVVDGVAAAAGALLPRPGLVDLQGTPLQLGAVQRRDGLVAAAGQLNQAEAARAAGVAVGGDLGPSPRAVVAEPAEQVVAGGLEGEVPHVDVLAHRLPFGALAGRGHSGPEARIRKADAGGRGAQKGR